MLRLKQIIALDVSRFCDATVRSPVSFGMYPSAADAGVVVPQATLPHQPLDAVRIAREPVGEDIMPDPTRARRPVVAFEALIDRTDEYLVVPQTSQDLGLSMGAALRH